MATINSWNNAVLAANITFSGGTMSIGTDSTDNAINIGTAASAGRTVTIGNGTGTSTTVIACGTGGITVGTSANVHTSTLGSTTTTSATTVQSGSGTLSLTATNGAITINSGTGTVSIGSDATNATYNFATGAGAKVVTLGSTNGASSLALKTGTADFSLASATGTIMSTLDTGETVLPLQSAFLGYIGSNVNNVVGDGATTFNLGTTTAFTEVFDQNSDFNTNGTFTAPVTGRYRLTTAAGITGCTIATSFTLRIVTTARTYEIIFVRTATTNDYNNMITVLADMTAADTAIVQIVAAGEAGNTDDLLGSAGGVNPTFFSGYLAC